MESGNVIELRNASVYHIKDARRRLGRGRNRLSGSELVLEDINLTIGQGEMVFFIGKVGSGKSTLLKTLYGEVELAEGEGRVAGYDLRKLRRKDIPFLRRRLGIVFQDYQLLTDRSVFHNLHYVLKATGWKQETEILRRIEEVLNVVELEHKMYKMPFQLSGGQQQRLAIARALLNSPRVLLADEPTGNLDPAASAEVMVLFDKIVRSGCSLIMATHNIANLEEYPSRTFRFSQCRMEEIDIKALLGN